MCAIRRKLYNYESVELVFGSCFLELLRASFQVNGAFLLHYFPPYSFKWTSYFVFSNRSVCFLEAIF